MAPKNMFSYRFYSSYTDCGPLVTDYLNSQVCPGNRVSWFGIRIQFCSEGCIIHAADIRPYGPWVERFEVGYPWLSNFWRFCRDFFSSQLCPGDGVSWFWISIQLCVEWCITHSRTYFLMVDDSCDLGSSSPFFDHFLTFCSGFFQFSSMSWQSIELIYMENK